MLLHILHLFSIYGTAPASLGKYFVAHLSGKIATVKFDKNSEKPATDLILIWMVPTSEDSFSLRIIFWYIKIY